MFFSKQKLCPGSGKAPIKMKVVFSFQEKELSFDEQLALRKQGKEPKVKLVADADGDFTCPWCEAYMDSDEPMISHPATN